MSACARRRYRHRYRARGRLPGGLTGRAAGAAVAAGIALGLILEHPHGAPAQGPGRPSTAAVIVPGGAGLGTRAGWARALLAADRFPQTSCNLSAVTEWEIREGGGFGNQAAYNPLNVNPGPGAGWPGYSATGAWAFPDAATGLRYTVATLNNGYYGGILTALRAGNSAQAVCDAIMASPWAASRYDGTLSAAC
jgi:hypothetical protein